MGCIICNGKSNYYFSKKFTCYGLNIVDYYKCSCCQFVFSKTHYEMSQTDWEILNKQYHSYLLTDLNADDPNWENRIKKQIAFIKSTLHLTAHDSILDFAAGNGLFSKSIPNVINYDPYFNDPLYLEILKPFDCLINTSYLEHITKYEHIQNLFENVKSCLYLHTFCADAIPNDPNWFYLLPVHCSFYSKKSIDILFERFGFVDSIYDRDSRMWGLYKHSIDGSGYCYKQNGFIGFV